MELNRETYISALIDRKHNGLIKMITGVKQSGKTYLLFTLFKNHLLQQGVDSNHILEFFLKDRKSRKFRNPDTILDFIEDSIKDDKQYYVFLDEVQMLDEFEEVLNSLLHIRNLDVYVTGSNSKFLSKDIITEFRGRGDEIHVYPLTFREFIQAYDGDRYEAFKTYITFGGLPYVATTNTDTQRIEYLIRQFQTTYLKDIEERYQIEKVREMDDLIKVLASTIGALSNPTKIAATFKSELNSDISVPTIKQYITYLEECFLISEANRYDVKGRNYIGTPVKYYFEDVGLRNAKLGFRQIEETHLMENVIYNELRARGYLVDVGVVQSKELEAEDSYITKFLEVDFIAYKGDKKYYIQSAYRLPDAAKVKQEKNSLIHINDQFTKYIIVNDIIRTHRDDDGIIWMGLFDFLLNDECFID